MVPKHCRYKTARRYHVSPGSLRGMKFWVYDSGIRVPEIVYWPTGIKPGQTIDEPVCSIDLMPTFSTLGGNSADSPKPKATFQEGDWIVLSHWDGPAPPGGSVQKGDVDLIKKQQLADFELYNLKKYSAQSNNSTANDPIHVIFFEAPRCPKKQISFDSSLAFFL
jgi:arylsulfatase A